MTVALAAAVVAALGLPHLLRLERTSPAIAAAIWMSALVLRALTAVFSALVVIFAVPAVELFSLVTHWCWHGVIPLIQTHLPVDGHAFGNVAVVAPAFILAASTLSVAVGLWRAAHRVRKLLSHCVIGPGPRRSLLLADGEVLIAAAGLRRPRVVVSAGALITFDDEELAAGLEHEHGHIARRHRYVLVAAELCRALGRFLPGTRMAARELTFHLERDADRYAVARRHEPTALASAICKAAQATSLGAPVLALGGGAVTRRVDLLLDADAGLGDRSRSGSAHCVLAVTMTLLATVSATALPAVAHAGWHGAGAARSTVPCAR